MRIFVFEEDPSLMKLLTLFLENLGHQVEGFTDAYSCPLYRLEACACPADRRCADAVLVNTRHPDRENIQILIDQEQKGCKLPNRNKAIMSASSTEQQEQYLRGLGFTVIRKPFRLKTVQHWLLECASRLQDS